MPRLVIHLAGEPVAQRWTAGGQTTHPRKPGAGHAPPGGGAGQAFAAAAALVCASAIGYYGSRGDEILTEDLRSGHRLPAGSLRGLGAGSGGRRGAGHARGHGCAPAWCWTRRGGALARMLPAFRMGARRPAGGGLQWMSWIHLDDLCEMFRFASEHPVRGAMNGVAPARSTNADFTRALAAALHRPAVSSRADTRAAIAVRRNGGHAACEPARRPRSRGSGRIRVSNIRNWRKRWRICWGSELREQRRMPSTPRVSLHHVITISYIFSSSPSKRGNVSAVAVFK